MYEKEYNPGEKMIKSTDHLKGERESEVPLSDALIQELYRRVDDLEKQRKDLMAEYDE